MAVEWMGWTDVFFWRPVVVVLSIAGAVTIGLWVFGPPIRHLAKHRVEWEILPGASKWEGPAEGREWARPAPTAFAELINRGPGAAMNVRFVGLGCRVEEEHVARERPPSGAGEMQRFTAWCSPDTWDKAQVAIIWTSLRVRNPRLVQIEPLHRFAERPRFEPHASALEAKPLDPALWPEQEPARSTLPARRHPLRRAQAMRELRRL